MNCLLDRNLCGVDLFPSPPEEPATAADGAADAATGDGDQGDALSLREAEDFEDLRHIATKREIRVTIRKGTQAGVAAGLTVMAGTMAAGPVGAVAGGAVGTALAAKIAKDVVPLNQVLAETPPEQRREVMKLFHESFKEEFEASVLENPELKLVLAGGSIFGVVRYMVDRDLVESEKLEKLDKILSKVPGEVLDKVKMPKF